MAAYTSGGAARGVHLIDDEGNLLRDVEIQNFILSALGNTKQKEALHRIGLDYHVVGVFGGQSSGKSTMLNCLFGTRFQTMDETRGRGQTTKGAFMSRAVIDANNSEHSIQEAPEEEEEAAAAGRVAKPEVGASMPLFVVDFEGTDGMERGEDQNFERQLSLFALCVADVLIINMWSVDVGRFNAANMSLLRTVFEVNLQLFSHDKYVTEEMPTLLIVLRDFTEDDTMHHIQTIKQSFDKIWCNIVKPEMFRDASIDALFTIRFHVLPHYKLQRDKFDRAIVAFREWFTSPTCENFLFRGRAMFRGVPLDGISVYLSSCWDVIRHSKDLDIPSQRDMLARHRCAEAKSCIASLFKEDCNSFMESLQAGKLVPNLSGSLDSKKGNRLGEFREQTKLYNESAVRETLRELEEELLAEELKLLGQYAKTIASVALSGMDIAVGSTVDGAMRWLLHEAQSLPLISTQRDGEKQQQQQLTYVSDSNNSGGWFGGAAPCRIDAVAMDNEKCNALVRKFWSRLCRSLQAEIEVLCEQPEEQRKSQLVSLYRHFATLVAQDPVMREAVVHAVLDALHQKLHHRFAAMAENASETIHQAFEHALTRREDGTVRFFSTTKGLRGAEPQARQAGLLTLGCLLYYHLKLVPAKVEIKHQGKNKSSAFDHLIRKRRKLDVCDNNAEAQFFLQYTKILELPRYPLGIPVAADESIPASDDVLNADCVLLTEQAVRRAFELYEQKCEFTIQLQHRTIENAKQNLPVWVLPAMLLLGWNEMWYIITSPVLLLVIAVIVVVFFKQFVVSQWELFEETGPTWIVFSVRTLVGRLRSLYETFAPSVPRSADSGDVRHRDPMSSSDVTGDVSGAAATKSSSSSAALPTPSAVTTSLPSSPGASLTRRTNQVKPGDAPR